MPHNTGVVLLALGLLGANAGALGVFAVARRRVLVVDAMGHAALPGLAGAFLLAPAFGLEGRNTALLLFGAATTALLAFAAIEALVQRSRLAPDAATGAVLATFFGLGLVLLGIVQRSGLGAGGLDRWIFGQAATLGRADATAFAWITLASLLVLALTWRPLLWTGFDPTQARTAGISPSLAAALFFGQLAVVTLAALPNVGLLLVVGFLALPAAAARPLVRRFVPWILLSSAIGSLGAVLGTWSSTRLENVPTGPAVLVALGLLALSSHLFAPRTGLLAVLVARARLRRLLRGSVR